MPKQSVTYLEPKGKLLDAKRLAETIEGNIEEDFEYLETLLGAEASPLAAEMGKSELLKAFIAQNWQNWLGCGEEARDQLDWLLWFAASCILVGYYLSAPKPASESFN
jgi:hypothetical protein